MVTETVKKGSESFNADSASQEKGWYNAEVLKSRLDSLNAIVRRRGSFVQINALEESNLPFKTYAEHQNGIDRSIELHNSKHDTNPPQERSDLKLIRLGYPHCLFNKQRSSSLTITDASRRLMGRFHQADPKIDETLASDQSASRKPNKREKSSLEEQMQKNLTNLKRNLKAALDENKHSYQKERLKIARDERNALKSRESTEEMAAYIMRKVFVRHNKVS